MTGHAFAQHNPVYVIAGLWALWLAFKSFRAGYRTLRDRKLPSELRTMDHVTEWLGIPEEYYSGRRLIVTGMINMGGGVWIGFCGLTLLFNSEAFGWVALFLGVSLILICAVYYLFIDSPWKFKGNSDTKSSKR